MVKILFIDDDIYLQKALKSYLPEEYSLISEIMGKKGIISAVREKPDVILLDIHLPDIHGLDVLSALTGKPHCPPVIMISGYGTIEIAVRAIRMGAYDFITKPYKFEQLQGTIRRAVEFSAISSSALPVSNEDVFSSLIGEDPQIKELKKTIRLYAAAESSVFITGESGTGKDLAANSIHKLSRRNKGPYHAINCGAIPDTLIETELFGSVKGAFTDAREKEGCFEAAADGTLFLDEIGEMSIQAQVKLLRVLEEKSITRVGSTRRIPINVRTITATNKDLAEAVSQCKFRQDLYYRINILPLKIPPLRERKDDLPLLCAHLLKNSGKKLLPSAYEKLRKYSWPGNIRELKNVMERAVLLSEGENIQARHIQFF